LAFTRHKSSQINIVFSMMLTIILLVGIMVTGCTAPAAPASTPAATTPATTTAAPAPAPSNPNMILATTTSTRDSGLLDALIPMFEKQTGYTVKTVAVGSGAAMTMGERGEADVLLVHAPESEVKFMDAKHGVTRKLIMHNDFVVLGPSTDPAKVKGSTSAIDAFKAIAAVQANFYSRGDNSGTDAKDKALFKSAGVTVKDKAPENPSWYIESGSGMLQTLQIASEKAGYTLSDRATYMANKDKLALEVVFENDPMLLNVYHVITVNPEKYPGIINAEGAKAFAEFIVGKDAQNIIAEFTDKNGQLLFVPDGGKTDADLGLK